MAYISSCKKPTAPVQTYRNHTTHFNSEGQKNLKKHITVIIKELGHIFDFFKVAFIHSSQLSCNNLYQMWSVTYQERPTGKLPKEEL